MGLVNIFLAFLKIGLFSIGGGYAVIPMIQQQVVDQLGWLTMQEYTDIITISQMTPGPLAVNTSTFVGIRLGGMPGAVVATVGCILGGCVISLVFYRFYLQLKENLVVEHVIAGLKSVSLGLIISAAFSMVFLALWGSMNPNFAKDAINLYAVFIFAGSLFVLRKFEINQILLLLMTGGLGFIVYYLLPTLL